MANISSLPEEKHTQLEQFDSAIYKTMVETMGVLLVRFCRNGRIKYANSAFCSFVQIAMPRLIDLPLMKAGIPFNVSSMVEEEIRHACISKSAHQFSVELVRNGSTQPQMFQCSVIPELIENNHVEFVLFTAQEVTKLLGEQLHQLTNEKMNAIAQLAGGIAHDFNNQLCAISGYADMILRIPDIRKEIHSFSERIIKIVQKTSQLTSQLLAFARKGKYLSLPVDIHELLSETIAVLEHKNEKSISITKKFGTNSCVTIGDPNQLGTVFLNMILNSYDAIENAGEIELETEILFLESAVTSFFSLELSAGSYLVVHIRDNGSGIDKEGIKHIFEPFFSTKDKGKGAGMGLAAAYGIIKNHKGAINLTSAPGKGTTFSVYLPLGVSTHHSGIMQKNEVSVSDRRLIMLVDDEQMVRDMVARMIELLGYASTIFPNGNEALHYYKDNWRDIDVVILDMIMPGMNGKTLYQEMKKVNSQVRVVLSSGYSIEEDAQSILNEGKNIFLQKPFRQSELSRCIKHLLD